jgi:predicted nucleic acid-binding protein
MKTALDSNILSALWSSEPSASHLKARLQEARTQGAVVICAPVYAELLAHPRATRSFVDQFLSDTGITVEFVLEEPVWRKAAEAFSGYAHRRRRSGGNSPKRLLVDFVIAAHALLQADRLLTLDSSRYAQDFPELRLM